MITPVVKAVDVDSTKTDSPEIIRKEVNTYSCAGYLSDHSGDGWFVYGELSFRKVKKNHLLGAFAGISYADCLFSGYQYYGRELVFGVNYTRWGQLNDNLSYILSASPCFKNFNDYGQVLSNGDEV